MKSVTRANAQNWGSAGCSADRSQFKYSCLEDYLLTRQYDNITYIIPEMKRSVKYSKK